MSMVKFVQSGMNSSKACWGFFWGVEPRLVRHRDRQLKNSAPKNVISVSKSEIRTIQVNMISIVKYCYPKKNFFHSYSMHTAKLE